MSSQLVTSNGHDLFAMALETQELPSKNQFSPNFTVSSQLVTPNGHDLFAMALETQDLPSQNQFSPNVFKLAKCNTRPSRSKPVQSQCVQTCQVQKCPIFKLSSNSKHFGNSQLTCRQSTPVPEQAPVIHNKEQVTYNHPHL